MKGGLIEARVTSFHFVLLFIYLLLFFKAVHQFTPRIIMIRHGHSSLNHFSE